jgi:Zn-dependent protease
MVKVRSLPHCVGGVIAQSVIAIPIILWVKYFGYSRFELVNIVFALLGFFSFAVMGINLLPIAPLDGSIAWAIFPEFFKRMRSR